MVEETKIGIALLVGVFLPLPEAGIILMELESVRFESIRRKRPIVVCI
jgi:uncharacterized protein YqgC (DUF456 family)